MKSGLLKSTVIVAALMAVCASVPAEAQDGDAAMHHHRMHRMMRHEMHHEMMHYMMRREMHHEMMHHRMHRRMMHHMMHDETRTHG